jgi:hypothetical protein
MMNLKSLQYKYGSEYVCLPDWATFFIGLGSAIASVNNAENRMVVGIAMPTRAYAACLIAAGYITTKFNLFEIKGNAYVYFKQLCKLEKGTSLTFFSGNKKLRAIFDGVDEINGEKRLRVQRSKEVVDLISPEKALLVNVAKSKLKSLPKKQKGKDIRYGKGLLGMLMSRNDFYQYSSNSRLDCVIIGRLKVLRQEITKTEFGFRMSKKVSEGNLQEILRTRRFLGNNEAFRSVIYPVNKKKAIIAAEDKLPSIAIFDGSSAFIKWRDNWRKSDRVALLDRTDLGFSEATNILNQGYMNRICQQEINNSPPCPPGIKMIAYQEKWQ